MVSGQGGLPDSLQYSLGPRRESKEEELGGAGGNKLAGWGLNVEGGSYQGIHVRSGDANQLAWKRRVRSEARPL